MIRIKTNEGNIRLEELEMYVIEFPKFKIENLNNMTGKEQWIQYLKGANEYTLEKIKNKNKYIEKLDELVEKYWLEEKME